MSLPKRPMYQRLHLPKTKAALAAWDAIQPEWESINTTTNEAVHALMKKEEEALANLRAAFYEETKEVNSESQASVIAPTSWLRRLVDKYGGQ